MVHKKKVIKLLELCKKEFHTEEESPLIDHQINQMIDLLSEEIMLEEDDLSDRAHRYDNDWYDQNESSR